MAISIFRNLQLKHTQIAQLVQQPWQLGLALLFSQKKYFYTCLFFCCISVYVLHVAIAGTARYGDSYFYYAYTRSLMMDHDLDLLNEARYPTQFLPTNMTLNPITHRMEIFHPPGISILWIPSFIVGQGGVLIANALGAQADANGYSIGIMTLVGITSVAFSIGSLILIEQQLGVFFSQKIARLAIVSLFLTTQLFHYSAVDPANSHSASVLFSAAIAWLMIVWERRKSASLLLLFAIGLMSGYMGTIRSQDILIAVPVFFLIITSRIRWSVKALGIMVTLLGAVIGYIPELGFSWYIFHRLTNPYMIYLHAFSWFSPDFIRVLFSSNNGQFYYAPLVGLSVVGCFWLWRNSIGQLRKQTMAGLLLFFAVLYIVASWVPEIIGGPYGSRMFTITLPWLAVGTAYLFKRVQQRHLERYWWLSIIVLTLWNWWQILDMLLRTH